MIPLRFWLLFACQALLVGGTALSFPFFALYLHRERGLPMDWTGACLSLVFLASAASQALGGALADSYGRKRIMAFSVWARALAALALAAAVRSGGSLGVLLALQLFSGFFSNFFDPAARSWVADNLEPGERYRAYSLLRIATNLGWAAGPAVGGALAGSSYAALFAATAAAAGLCGLGVVLGLQDRGAGARSKVLELSGALDAARDPRFLRLNACNLLLAVVSAQLVVSLSIHATRFIGLRETEIGLLFSLNGLMVVLLQYPLSRWCGRRRITWSLASGSLLYALGYAALGFASSFPQAAACMAVVTLGEIMVSPGLYALAASLAPEEARGRYQGFLGLTYHLGAALGPFFGGWALERLSPWSPAAPWLVVAGAAVAAAFGFWSMRRLLTREEEIPTPSPGGRASVPSEGDLSHRARGKEPDPRIRSFVVSYPG